MKISAKELRNSSTKIIEQAAKGTEIIITVRGKKMARLIPFDKEMNTDIEQDEIFGLWENHAETQTAEEQVRSFRIGRKF